MSPMPQTPPPDDDFPRKPPTEQPIVYTRATRTGRWHMVIGPVPQRGPWSPALCGFLQLRGWRYRFTRPSSPFSDKHICPRCLETLRRRGAQLIPASPELAEGAEANVERAS